MEFAKLDFQQLRVYHISFKSKVRAVLYGGNYNHTMFTSSNPVNEWLSTIGKVKYSSEPEIQKLHKVQSDFFITAETLVDKYRQDQIEEALAGMWELNELSDNFLQVLQALEKRYTR